VLLIDIDLFKAVNDTYGHQAGDQALRAVATSLTGALRDYDRAGRYGGEEFALLLPHTAPDDAYRIAERLRIAETPVTTTRPARPHTDVAITVSIGVATLDDTHGTLADVVAAADAALYQAKDAGRNCTRKAEDVGLPLRELAGPRAQPPAERDLP
jgi:diguanylate cyclase (GGDEF)-like protein